VPRSSQWPSTVIFTREFAFSQLTLSFSAVARLLLVRRFLGIWPFDRRYARLVVPTAAGGVAMWLIATLIPDARWGVELLVAGGGGGLAYAATVLVTGLPAEERAVVVRLAGRAFGRDG